MATLVLEEGFEDLTGWTLVSTTAQGRQTGRTGVGWGFTTSAGTATYPIPAGAESDTITIGLAWRTVNLGGTRFITSLRSDTAATVHLTVQALATGAVEVRRGTAAGTVLATSTAGLLAVNTWAYIEVQTKLHDTTGFVTVRVNGTQVAAVTAVDTKNAGTKTTFDAIFLSTTGTITDSYDDLYIVTGADGAFRGDQSFEGTGPFNVSHEPFHTGFGAWTVVAGTPAFVPGRHGNGVQLPSSAQLGLAFPAGTASYYVVVGFAMFVPTTPATTDFVGFRIGATSIGTLRLGATGVLSLSGIWAVSAAGAVPVATWCYVEISLLANPPTVPSGYTAQSGEIEIRVNGSRVGYSGDVNLSGTTTGIIDTLRLTGIASTTVIYDDLYVISGTRADFEGDQTVPIAAATMKYRTAASTFADGPVAYWNGSDYINATGVKTWTGSAFV